MLNLTTTYYLPDAEETKILDLMSEGKTQKEIAELFGDTPECIRQRVHHLRLKLGALTNEQMMYEYGKYKERNKK